jgi:hypothetical protein
MKYYKDDFSSDFGGIDPNAPDFITQGTSGLGATDILSSFLTPELKSAAITSAKSTGAEIAKFIWAEYKVPIIIGGLFVVGTLFFENYANYELLKRTKK